MDVWITVLEDNTDFTGVLFLLSVLQNADVTANTVSVGLNSLAGHTKLKLEMCEKNGYSRRLCCKVKNESLSENPW